MPAVRCSEAESGMVTRALVPLNTSALPDLPALVHVAFAIVPVFPFPDASATVVPVPSLNEYAAIRPGIVARAGERTTRSSSWSSWNRARVVLARGPVGLHNWPSRPFVVLTDVLQRFTAG